MDHTWALYWARTIALGTCRDRLLGSHRHHPRGRWSAIYFVQIASRHVKILQRLNDINTTHELQRQDSLFLLGSAKKVLRSLITIYVYPGIPMNIPQCQRKWFAGVLGSAGAGNPPGIFLASLHPLIGSIIKHNVLQNLGYDHYQFPQRGST